MSITDDIMNKAPDNISKASDITLKAAKEAREGIKDAAGMVKGICLLLLDGAEFTESSVMKAVKEVAFRKTGDIKFSKNNIDIEKLRKSGHVYKVEDSILSEVMHAFDRQCKKYGIKYSAMIDTKGEGKPDNKPSYMIFFEGEDDKMIMSALAEAYVEYEKHQKAKAIAKEIPQQSKRWLGKKKDQEQNDPEQRESVKAKLAFFRDRVAARDKERDAIEKHHQHDDISR